MTALERKLKATLKRLQLDPASAVLIGVSGGADSMALLDAMWRLSQGGKWHGRILGAHVNHLLRGAESDADEQFVQAYQHVKTITARVDVDALSRQRGENLEAAARHARYDFFREMASECKTPLVFTAHSYDDQVETLLMRWMRGTGADGLRGIRQDRALCQGVRLIRPLLDVTRAEVLEHCATYCVEYRTDSSNLVADFTRNRVRQELLPLLRTFNPQIGAALLRGASHWQADAAALDELARSLFERSLAGGNLAIKALATAPASLRVRVLRLWLGQEPALPELSAVHWQALDQLLTRSQSGRHIELPKGWRVQREFDRLRFWQERERGLTREPDFVALTPGEPQAFGEYEITIFPPMPVVEAENYVRAQGMKYYALLNEQVLASPLGLRARQSGDAYIPAGRKSPEKLKALLIRNKVPASQRARHPLLLVKNEIAWSPGLPAASAFSQLAPNEHCALVIARERCNLSVPEGVIHTVEESRKE